VARQPRHSIRYGRIALGPVVTIARDQPHTCAVTPGDQPEAVVLDFVNSAGPRRGLSGVGGDARLERDLRECRTQHAVEICRNPVESNDAGTLRTELICAGLSPRNRADAAMQLLEPARARPPQKGAGPWHATVHLRAFRHCPI
jgi:hypothetical protein